MFQQTPQQTGEHGEPRPGRSAADAPLDPHGHADAALNPDLVLASTMQGFYECNVITGQTRVSREYAQMLGFEPEEMTTIQSAWIDRLHPDECESAQSRFMQHAHGQTDRYRAEFRMSTRDGRWVWILSVANIIERDAQGRAVRFVGTHTDITDIKSARDDLQRRQAQSSQTGRLSLANGLASVIAHELNQPLCAVVNHLAALQHALEHEPGKADPIRREAAFANHAAHRAAKIVRRLRDLFSRHQPREAQCELARVLDQSIELISTDLKDANIRLRKAYDPNTPPVFADPTLIQQVILNLATNAIDAMSAVAPDRRELIVSLDFEPGNNMVKLRISDNGPGFTQDAIDNLFLLKDSAKADGLGMGLCICRLIVRAHGGEIGIEHTSEHGSTLLIRLPSSKPPIHN